MTQIFCPLWCIWSGWRRHRHLLPHISLLLLSSSTLFGIFIIGTAPNSNSTQWQRNEGRLSDGVGFSLFWIDRLCNSFHFFAFGTLYLFALGHWTSQISLHFFPLLCTAQLFTILCTFSNSLHFALWCSLLCTYRPFHAHTTFLTTLLLPSILWRLHQSFQFSSFSPLQRVYRKSKSWSHPKVESCHLHCTMCSLFRIFFRATEQAQTYLKIRKILFYWTDIWSSLFECAENTLF